MAKVLGVDFETQGLDTLTTNITEVGAILHDTESTQHAALVNLGELQALVWDETYPPQPKEIVELTGITDEMLKAKGILPKVAIELLISMMGRAEYVIAHNKDFDEAIFKAQCARYGLEVPAIQWICTKAEVPYAPKFKCRKLSHLAYDHGVMVHVDTLHRAMDDVALMLKLLGKYKFSDVLEYANQPWITLRAVVPTPFGARGDGGKGKDWAKSKGYGWEMAPGTYGPKFDKCWVKRVKEKQVEAEMKDAEYQIVILENHDK